MTCIRNKKNYALRAELVLCGANGNRFLIAKPLPQKEARQRPIIAIAMTEHAGGTA